MKEIYLLLGSNLGNREEIMTDAIEMIGEEIGHIDKKSMLYETEPWGFDHENSFLNQVISCHSKLSPLSILDKIHEIEFSLGRERKNGVGYEGRTVDIDILLIEGDIIKHPKLNVPHLKMQERRFVLIPLAQVAPKIVHPILNKTILQLLKNCDDQLEVTPYQ